MPIDLKHANKSQLLAALRERYAASTGAETLRLAAKIKTHMDAGDITDADMRGAFGLSVAGWATAKSRITSHASTHATTKSARGE